MDFKQMQAELDKLKSENEALKAANAAKNTLSLKVSEKGALSLYGLGRFPVTLYKSQWNRLIESTSDISAFIAANDAKLIEKPANSGVKAVAEKPKAQ